MSNRGEGGWVCLLPTKPPSVGKSRLDVPDATRRELAAAFALDTATAARLAVRVAVVLAVTDDARFADRLSVLGCEVVPDGVGADLNGSLVQAAAEARRRWPGLRPVALCADLPALRPADLDAALAAAEAVDGSSYVADADGVGTTLYAASSYDAFVPRFGHRSATAHVDAGARAVPGDLATLRRDVDTAAAVARLEV
ncbi:2-phospho-L-lactate guanylyltransferase [Nocardioides sp. CFH 31398]|uniref:2-phospho-L-lactate guanylyltransferase n=1 Tax=Nocardioides sp. CFH 31398 TaxID=2919579 RepID=UPI001F0655AB|nr:2-phospho-L-lactate guanylyltransferase [Nocardioides sp. CFH 31398]MCH1867363.1 2-phospho-L-lactate guanylyltransferase [Nocardioides sp. CFH 31398]